MVREESPCVQFRRLTSMAGHGVQMFLCIIPKLLKLSSCSIYLCCRRVLQIISEARFEDIVLFTSSNFICYCKLPNN